MKKWRLELKASVPEDLPTVHAWRRRCFSSVEAAEKWIAENTFSVGGILFSGYWWLVKRTPGTYGRVFENPMFRYPRNVTAQDIWKRREYIGDE